VRSSPSGTLSSESSLIPRSQLLEESDLFPRRHIGPSEADIQGMLLTLGVSSLDDLMDQTIPAEIRSRRPLQVPGPFGEHSLLGTLRSVASQNRVFRSFIGMGYYDCITPAVIQRNILENPGWYTQYTPYQAEIAQGRLEALLNFQTLVAELTGLPLANASLLDEATAAAEAMSMCRALSKKEHASFFVSEHCHPQTIAVLKTRAKPLGFEVIVGTKPDAKSSFGILLQYPDTHGRVLDLEEAITAAHESGALAVVATDLLALTLLRPPGEFGADVAIGSSQRFGVPLGFGGPHAAFLSTRDEYRRHIPGRLVGISKDAEGRRAYRMALQTREQHIRREKATSNICTAQVLLAVMASMYAVYHGPEGLKRIARRVHALACLLSAGLKSLGFAIEGSFFDTITIRLSPQDAERVYSEARAQGMNLRDLGDGELGVSLDETKTRADVLELLTVFAGKGRAPSIEDLTFDDAIPEPHPRKGAFLAQEVFNRHHSEHEMLRYMRGLEARDLSLTTSMIPLGSCTMKLNGTSEMFPVTWPEFARLHPFAPREQTRGYDTLFSDLETWLGDITGFAGVSLQPNAGSQGEYAGLLAIRAYHASRGETGRDVCLIPVSAHGTNPASAVTAGFRVIPVACDEDGNVLLADLEKKAKEHAPSLGALMVTYPSTHGVFEEGIKTICALVHGQGGQVYMDGANMNAQVGLTRPAEIGADVCHLNLHKTFCIPHGGGGPGMGPIAVAAHLVPFLPGRIGRGEPGTAVGPVSAAPYGSASILTISWMYIALMGAEGLRKATEVAILNANYMAERLQVHYPVLYRGKKGRVAHEFILDMRPFQKAGIEAEDIAKRLMDYGFHAPTMSFPVAGTLMIEPTESEPKVELDRFCEALILIREEIRQVEEGRIDPKNNPLKNAPHTARAAVGASWDRPYTREQGVFPAPWVREHKFWPSVARIDNVYGDRNLVCTCPSVESYGLQE
jgi:glycine dehydrogenase